MAGVFDTNGKLALQIEREGLTLSQVSVCANILRCPMGSGSREFLITKARQKPFKIPVTQYQIIDSRRNRFKAVQLFTSGLQQLQTGNDQPLAILKVLSTPSQP